MKANELRIGNWVHDIVGDFQITAQQIAWFSEESVAYREVPLTEDLLLKFGCVKAKDRDDFFRCGILIIIIDFDGDFAIRLNVQNGDSVHLNHLKFAHQLQNLYQSLTGIDLEFTA